MRRVLSSVVALTFSFVLQSCGGDSNSPSQPPPPAQTVSTVSVSPTAATLAPGETQQLSAVARDASGATVPGKTPTWASQTPSVATVSSTGLVTGVAAGSAAVNATIDGRSGSATITVTPAPVATVSVAPTETDLFEGETVQLVATLQDAAGNDLTDRDITWSSSGPTSASVDDSGLVTALVEGSATITASAEGVTGSASITVLQRPVAAVEVTPDPADVTVGQTVQLAAVAKDDEGNELTGRVFVWSTTDPAVASVDEAGLVTGEAVGSAEVSATAEAVAGTTTVTVAAPTPLVITQITPNPLVEGAAATLTGTGFSPTPADNAVMVGAMTAMVTAATTTSLDIVVPTTMCRPKRGEPVVVAAGGQTSDAAQATVSPPSFLDMAVGDLVTLTDPSNLCLQFDEAGGSERYLFGVQAVSEVASALTGVSVAGEIAAAAAPSQALPPMMAATSGNARAVDSRSPDETRWTRHDRSHIALLERQRRELGPLIASQGFKPVAAMATAPAAIPGDVEVGTEIGISFPDLDGSNLCQNPTPITVVVKRVSARGIFVEDKNAPANGFTDADYDDMATDLDGTIYDTNVDYFGAPSDMDTNDRIVIVITPEVNKTDFAPLAFVTSGDLFPLASCPASNEGEFYYARAPDPTGMFSAGVYATDDARLDNRALIAHEMAHIIQGSRRMMAGGQIMTLYMAEGGGAAAEQFNAFAFEGRSGGQNLGADVVYFGDERAYYRDRLTDPLLLYFGWDFFGNHVEGAPEQCTWVGSNTANPGVCSESVLLIYGLTWAIVQHSIDRLGAALGGEKAVHRALVDHAGTPGFGALEAVFNAPVADLLAPAAAMLAIDDRYMGPGLMQHQFANFNLRNLEDAWQDPDARLTPYAYGFEGFLRSVSVRGGSSAYFDISGVNRPATSVRVTDQAGEALPQSFQVWIVRVQ